MANTHQDMDPGVACRMCGAPNAQDLLRHITYAVVRLTETERTVLSYMLALNDHPDDRRTLSCVLVDAVENPRPSVAHAHSLISPMPAQARLELDVMIACALDSAVRADIFAIVAPALSGKSALRRVLGHDFIRETDDAERGTPDAMRGRLRALRSLAAQTREWDAYYAAWHPVLRAWASGLPSQSIILAHSFRDAEAIAIVENAVFLPQEVFGARLQQASPPTRSVIAVANRRVVRDELDARPSVQVYSDLPTAMLAALLQRTLRGAVTRG